MSYKFSFNLFYFLSPFIITLVILRFINITKIPIFGDEALYLYLAEKILDNPSTVLDSIPYDVLPVFIWFQSAVLLFFGWTADPLTIGRFSTTVIDLVTALLIFLIGAKLRDRYFGLLVTFTYLSLPLTFFHSRFALMDSLTNFFILFALWYGIKAILSNSVQKQINLSYIFTQATLIVFAFFCKPNSVVSYPAVFIILSALSVKKDQKWHLKYSLANIIFSFILGAILIFLLFQPVYHRFGEHYVNDSSNLGAFFFHMKTNIWKSIWWIKSYITLPLLLFIPVATVYTLLKKSFLALLMLSWFVIVFILTNAFGNNYYPRHLFPLAPPVSFMLGYLFYSFCRSRIIIAITLLILFTPTWFTISKIILNPQQAPIALEDTQQFFDDWSSGVGIKEVAQQLKKLSSDKKISVFVEDIPSQTWVLTKLYDSGNSLIIPSKELTTGLLPNIDDTVTRDIYMVSNKSTFSQKKYPIKLVYAHPKGPFRSISIFKLNF